MTRSPGRVTGLPAHTHPRYPMHRATPAAVAALEDIFIGAALAALLLAQAMPPPARAQSSGGAPHEWGVVLGADKTRAKAEWEVAGNARILGQRPRLYMCNGWVRTVAAYGSKVEALKALRKVRDAGSKRSPYIVSLWQWCPEKKLLPPG